MILVISSARKQKHVSNFRHSSRNDLSGVQEWCFIIRVTFGYVVLVGLYPGSQISSIHIGLLLKKKAFLNVVTREWLSVPLPLCPSKMKICKINPVLLRKERNRNV